ncbi:MAG: VanZ family protein [Lachnospiraceae bacterium]|nr:VanZ family protein [Lachnospiraceae bacterium]
MLHKRWFKRLVKAAAFILFFIYIGCLIYFLFFSERYGRTEISENYRYNLEPFKEIKRFWVYRDIIGCRMVMVNLLGNVLVFVPFGFLLPVFYSHMRRWYAILPVALIFIILVECLQLVTRVGTFDVDDIILNMSGVILGFTIFKIFDYKHRRRTA